MKPLYTFPFTVITKPNYRTKLALFTQRGPWSAVNPRIAELEWRDEMSGVDFGLRATLWGSEEPWRADEALAEIAATSGGAAQDPSLEAALPDALRALRDLRSARDPELSAAIRYRPSPAFRVLFPALSADWNIGAKVSVEADPHKRRNSPGRRLAMAVCCEIARARGHRGTLAAAKLFPCTCSGEEYPHPVDSFLLQIHR